MGRYDYESNAALVIYAGAERGSEEGNDSYLFLSGGYCGEDEFLSKEAVSYRIGTGTVVYCAYVK